MIKAFGNIFCLQIILPAADTVCQKMLINPIQDLLILLLFLFFVNKTYQAFPDLLLSHHNIKLRNRNIITSGHTYTKHISVQTIFNSHIAPGIIRNQEKCIQILCLWIKAIFYIGKCLAAYFTIKDFIPQAESHFLFFPAGKDQILRADLLQTWKQKSLIHLNTLF